MESISIIIECLLALALGGVIGLEREPRADETDENNKESFRLGGVRTFSLIALFGAVSGIIMMQSNYWFALVLSGAFFLIIIAYYIVGGMLTKSIGLTTEVAAIGAFVIGVLITTHWIPTHIVIALAVIVTLVLSLKKRTKKFASRIHNNEINAFLIFAILALVILPFLPDKTISLFDMQLARSFADMYQKTTLWTIVNMPLFNPFRLWLVVVLITGVQLLGHVLQKWFGKKRGWILASIAGGLVSSTSTTVSLAKQSLSRQSATGALVSCALYSNATSFIPLLILIAPINGAWMVYVAPVIIIMTIAGFLSAFVYQRAGRKIAIDQEKETEDKKIFSLEFALKFALVIVGISVIANIASTLFGKIGLVGSTIIGALTGLDAITIVLAANAGGVVDFRSALILFVVAHTTNMVAKIVYARIVGTKAFAGNFALGAIVMAGAGVAALLVL